MKKNWLLWLILLISLFLGLFKLGSNPTFIADEASIGYNAYSILKTGRDEWGKFLPLVFKAFGEYKLPVYIYFSVLPIAFLGLNEFSTRLVSALFGVLSVYFVFLLAGCLWSRKENKFHFQIISAFLFAINPWHFQISRMAIEANLALSFFLLGFTFFQQKKFNLAFFIFALTFYTYNAFRVFIPLFLILIFIFKETDWQSLKKPLLIFFLLVCPLLVTGFKGSGERVFKTSIFYDPGIVFRIQENRARCQSELPSILCRVVFNRPVAYTAEISKNYLSHYYFKFLLFGSGLAQYGLPNFGVVYYFQLPFLVYGLWRIIKTKSLKEKILPWLIAAPVATSITGPAHPLRSLVFMPLLPLVSSLGLIAVYKQITKKLAQRIFLTIIFGFSIFGLSNFLYQYFRFYPTQTGSTWQSGYKYLYQYLEKQENNYRQIRVTKFYGEPHIFYLFYNRYNPRDYQLNKNSVIRYDREDRWVNVDRIDKYYFFEKPDFVMPGLVVLSAYESQPTIPTKEIILFPNGQTAFKVYEINL